MNDKRLPEKENDSCLLSETAHTYEKDGHTYKFTILKFKPYTGPLDSNLPYYPLEKPKSIETRREMKNIKTYDLIISNKSSKLPKEKRTLIIEVESGRTYVIGDSLTVMMAQYDNAHILFRGDNVYIDIDWVIESFRERQKREIVRGLMKMKLDAHNLWMKSKEE